MQYLAHDVAVKVGISVPTLHYYEKAGLLPPIRRNESGSRVYTEENIEWLHMIMLMRKTDMPIREIQKYIQLLIKGPETMSERYVFVTQYKQSIEEKLKVMQTSLNWLEAKASFYQGMMETGQNKSCSTFIEEYEIFKKSQGEN